MTATVPKKLTTVSENEVDLGRFIGELIDHKKLIITITSVFTVLAILYAFLATPVYQADALIQVEQKQGNAILDSLSQMLPDSQPISAPEIALLQSRMVVGQTVDDLNLQINVSKDYFPIVGKGLARLFGNVPGTVDVTKLTISGTTDEKPGKLKLTVIDDATYSIKLEDAEFTGHVGKLLEQDGTSIFVNEINAKPGETFIVTSYTKLDAIDRLLKNFAVADQGKDTGMLNLTYSGEDKDKIVKILDNISYHYLTQNIDRQAAQDAKSLDFLNDQLPRVRSDLDQAEDRLNAYRKQKDSVDLPLEAKAVLDQVVNVDNQLNELTFKEAEVSQLYTKEHPTYKALLEKRQTLQQERQKLNQQVSAMPATQQEVLRLSRDVESGRAVYMQLLNRQQELSIAKSSAIGNVRIVDNSVTQATPVRPKKALVILMAIILGMLFSCTVVVIKTVLRRGITSADDLESLGANVYAAIPESEWLTKKINFKSKAKNKKESLKWNFLANENPTDTAIEAIRSLRTSLHFAMMTAKNKILMISGASPSVGKTFISANLASICAQGGKSVLYIDADMRKGYAHHIFQTKNDIGLSNILKNNKDYNEGVHRIKTAQSEFDFISRGDVMNNPTELLMSEKFESLISWANDNYDLVIIDTPPVLAVSDAELIGSYAGTCMLVARFEHNTPKEMEMSCARFEKNGVKVKGFILNGVRKRASNYYGYGYSYENYSYTDVK
ncbi:polysaccharide biosynthesis tyrosine autokinase [Pantoea phytobeneficialis]|uniref:Polysaccharide biosynthesis tyrosine autokinase n=1 Tax=Pantoea phytobeneficialis TaxID=2052056 RepID=A0AAP9HAI5_9GAMM|nr:polysaccharide biosynthesis tyrosine autokinase [Pantoea phytobeneficialis]MDO6407407.1 polysaccharide biosynthesis tyrosine autokinase [Pantoea phytobeneficialis]QGR09544.1 tyrosine-protein kinase [Pantoea phytobeneficialis]